MTASLFPDLVPIVLPEAEPVEKLSAGRRLTLRQHAEVAVGRHPLTHGRLYPAEDARCGNCRFRELLDWHNRTYPKCVYGDGYRVAHSTQSDVRAWWPGCVDWELGDPKVSADAARWQP